MVGAYALGKAQRLIAELRCRGHHDTIYIHGALATLCDYYRAQRHRSRRPRAGHRRRQRLEGDFAGAIVVGPPSAFAGRWVRRFADPLIAFASGWMRIRQRARQRGVELPLIISDHADWDELCRHDRRSSAPPRSG